MAPHVARTARPTQRPPSIPHVERLCHAAEPILVRPELRRQLVELGLRHRRDAMLEPPVHLFQPGICGPYLGKVCPPALHPDMWMPVVGHEARRWLPRWIRLDLGGRNRIAEQGEGAGKSGSWAKCPAAPHCTNVASHSSSQLGPRGGGGGTCRAVSSRRTRRDVIFTTGAWGLVWRK